MIIFRPHEIYTILKQYLSESSTIVEAGAFDGKDTIKLATTFPMGAVHAFEPVPALFKKLTENTKHLTNVHCYQYALSDKNGSAELYVAKKPEKPGIPSQASSLRKPKERLTWSPIQFPYSITVETITLDSWAEQYHINHIDFLWLDMQGQELNVLKASPRILSTVSIIYTEVAFIEAYEHQPQYEEVKSWLEQQGFKEIGKTFEDVPPWFFGNILMVR